MCESVMSWKSDGMEHFSFGSFLLITVLKANI